MSNPVVGTSTSTVSSSFDLGAWAQTTDPQILRLAQFVMDQIASINTQQTSKFGAAGVQVRSGAATFTGSSTAITTGLTTVTRVVASVVDSDPTTAGDALVVTVGLNGTAGKIDLYAWKNTAGTIAAATNACTIHWIAWGT